MSTAYFVVALVTMAANTFSGLVPITGSKALKQRLRPAMAEVGIPESWMIFPIGVLKLAGAAGLFLGLVGVPLVGTAAAVGLVLFFVCASYTHVLAGDYRTQFFLGSCFFLPLAVATLTLDLAR